jgi:hypothetical protein
MPKLAVDPGDPCDHAVALDGPENCSCVGIDLINLPVAILPHPECPFSPRKPRIAPAARRWDRGQDMTGVRIDLLDPVHGDLKQVATVEGCSRVRGDVDRAHRLPTAGIEGLQLVSGSKPDVPAVKRDPVDVVSIAKRSVLTEDFGR